MGAGAYVQALVTIISGLAITDIIISLNRVIRAHRRVNWDWLALAGTALAAVLIVVSWWLGWQVVEAEEMRPVFGRFLVILAQLTLLFLFACAALPDEIPESGLDLREYYDRNGPYFWGLYSACAALFLVKDVVMHGFQGPAGHGWIGVAWAAGSLAAGVALMLVRRRWLHMILVPALLFTSVVPNLGWELGPGG